MNLDWLWVSLRRQFFTVEVNGSAVLGITISLITKQVKCFLKMYPYGNRLIYCLMKIFKRKLLIFNQQLEKLLFEVK